MEKEKTLKIIGIAMCLPAVIMAIYIAFHLSVIFVALLTAISVVLFIYGLKLARGATLDELKDDIKEDLDNLKK